MWPHQSCWSTRVAIWLVGLQSSKKPIRDCFSRCRPFLKLFAVGLLTFTVWWFKLFHLLTSRSVKKCRLTSILLLCPVSFNSWPLRCFVADDSNRFHSYSRKSFNHLKYFNEVGSVASFLQTPESKRLSLSQYGS